MRNQSSTEKILFSKLETEEISRETWKKFIRTYCQRIHIRPWLVSGSMITISQPELWNEKAVYGIILSAHDYDNLTEVLITIIHELIHIQFYVVGMKKHDEDSVERLGKILAKRYPFILDIFEEIFPGLRFTREYMAEAFNKPVTLHSPLPHP